MRAFSIEPEGIAMTEQEKQQKDQDNMRIAQQGIVAQMEMQLEAEKQKAIIDEKKSVSDDQRKQDMGERLQLVKEGNTMTAPPDYERSSILLREEMEEEQEKAIMQELQQQATDHDFDMLEQGIEDQDAQAQEPQQALPI